MMVSRNESGSKESSDLGGTVEKFYKELPERLDEASRSLWFGEGFHAYETEGVIIFECPNEFCSNELRNRYDPLIKNIFEQIGYHGSISYSACHETQSEQQMSLDLGSPRPIKKKEDLVARCSRYGYLENSFHGEMKTILHGGNKPVYREIENILEKLKSGKNCWNPLIVHGANGLGKTHALNYLLYHAQKEGIPSVGYNVGALADFLNSKNNPREKDAPNPEWYTLAKDHAKLVVLDQSHGLFFGGGSKVTHREGTQKWIFKLIEGVQKRDGNIIMSFTDIGKLDWKRAVEILNDGKEYSGTNRYGETYSTIGNKDLGNRLKSYFPIEIEHVPDDDYWDIVKGISGGNGALISGGLSSSQIVETFVAAGYGERKTLRDITEKVRNVVRASRVYETPVTRELIMQAAGSKKAQKKFALGGFDFNEKSDHGSGSFLDNYSVADIGAAFYVHRNKNKLDLGSRNNGILNDFFQEWIKDGDAAFLLDGDDSVKKYKALKELLGKYEEYRGPLFSK